MTTPIDVITQPCPVIEATAGGFFTDGRVHPDDDDDKEDSDRSSSEEFDPSTDLGDRAFPQSTKDADYIDKLLADEVEKLTLEEKERVIFDVHGISHEGGDPDNVESLLEQLELEICKTPDKEAYEQAKKLNKEYVTDRAFRLMFLRCDEFDVKVAAQHIVGHFEVKKELFGDGAILGRDVRISDFSSEADMEALECGFWQILPVRDAAGRLVLFQSPAFLVKPLDDDSMIRVVFYIHFLMSREEIVQKKGMVIVSWWNEKSFKPTKVFSFLRRKMTMIRKGIPRKISCVHFLIAQAYLRPVVSAIRWFNRDDVKARTRCHFGDLEQLKFDLQTFGIPTDTLPIFPAGGNPILANHKQWIVSQSKQEERGSGKSEIIVPGRFDVLLGRAHSTRSHPGNVRAHHMVEMFRDKYEAAAKFEKTAIAERIVVLIQKSHGRFLKWEDDAWVEVDQQTARNKISHLYRNKRGKTQNTKYKAPVSSPNDSTGSNLLANEQAYNNKRTHENPETQPAQKRWQGNS